MTKTLTPEIGNVIGYRPYGGGVRWARVINLDTVGAGTDRQAFSAVVTDGPITGQTVWGFVGQIISIYED